MHIYTGPEKMIYKNSFQGKFLCNNKLKPKQAKCLNKILQEPCNGITSENLLKKMPFDVDVVCLNPSKRAINPRFKFWIQHTKKEATLQGCISLTSKNTEEFNASKLNKFITNFKNKFDSLKGDEKLTEKEELCRQVDFILFGKYEAFFE